jgi:hypothetical protein
MAVKRQIDPDLLLVAMSGLVFRETPRGPAQDLQNRTASLARTVRCRAIQACPGD